MTTKYIPSVSELVQQIVSGDDAAKTTFNQIMAEKSIAAIENFEPLHLDMTEESEA